MKIREAILIIISTLLFLSNIGTVVLYSHQISEMRTLSSFRTIAKEEATFKDCLERNGIENKTENGLIKVREVDSRSAINMCA